MGEVIDFPAVATKREAEISDYFGLCPHCMSYDECLNVESDHWYVCNTHRTKWHIGSNLFSSWREENWDIWQGNMLRYAGYQEVKPAFYKDSPA